MSIFLENNFKGIIVPSRPGHERLINEKRNFNSTVVNKIPIGLPPVKIRNVTVYKKPFNEVDMRNKKFIRTLQNYKKEDKNLLETTDLRKSNKIKTFNNTSVNFPKSQSLNNYLNTREVRIKTEEEIKNDEFNKLLQDLTSFDYDKYVKDLELKEALYLIKSKIDKESHMNEEKTIDNEIQTLIDEQNEYNEEKQINREEMKIQDTAQSIPGKIYITPDQIRKKYAETLLKNNSEFRNVHSIHSIIKLLERQGIGEKLKLYDDKHSEIEKYNYIYEPLLLPHLHGNPLK